MFFGYAKIQEFMQNYANFKHIIELTAKKRARALGFKTIMDYRKHICSDLLENLSR